ncbi:MAG: flagellar basal body P-ring formation protein FlgA [Methylobacteriaceae bacterium]|nr:flagellar basal body P-ring formation protein FlgA [Methylobacteriaceae bacterium]
MTALRPRRFLTAPLLAVLLPAGALAEGVPTLRSEVVARHEAVTLGELVENAPASLADRALFRAPALGQSGTIQAARVTAALATLGLAGLDTQGRLQVVVTRAARRVGPSEIEAAVRNALAAQAGLDPAATGISFEGPEPALVLPPDAMGPLVASDLAYDRRSRRVTASLAIQAGAGTALRVAGTVSELVEVAVATRAIERGETVRPSDIALERRPREAVPSDALFDGRPQAGQVARRALGAGTLVRTADLARPELVGRGDVVTAVYEKPGMALSMRVKATESGALGDWITVVNPASKKSLQATVTGAGRVSVSPDRPERVATAAPPVRP